MTRDHTEPDLVEKVARAIACVASRNGTLCEGEEPGDNWEAWEEEARAAIAAMEATHDQH